MKHFLAIMTALLILGAPTVLFTRIEGDIISLYDGSKLIYDDSMGFEEYPIILNDSTVTVMEGNLRRQWCQAPEGRSPLEIIRNYESALESKGGEILFSARDVQTIEIEGKKINSYFQTHRRERGLATNVFSYTYFPGSMSEFLVAKIPTADMYVTIAAGQGHSAARQANLTYFELVFLEVEPMELGMVTMSTLQEGLALHGRLAIYNIYFDTGESTVRDESAAALEVIANYLKENPSETFFVVGHTDNVGSYEMNLTLSVARAQAVVEKLQTEYEIIYEQLKPIGVGPASPLMSNSSEKGRARNRRVELVER